MHSHNSTVWPDLLIWFDLNGFLVYILSYVIHNVCPRTCSTLYTLYVTQLRMFCWKFADYYSKIRHALHFALPPSSASLPCSLMPQSSHLCLRSQSNSGLSTLLLNSHQMMCWRLGTRLLQGWWVHLHMSIPTVHLLHGVWEQGKTSNPIQFLPLYIGVLG